jgi:cysteine desulfurase
MIYLDWNATTPPHAEVTSAMLEASATGWANPASTHRHGSAARRYVESARQEVATLFGVDVRDVVLTSGGTEANNLAVHSATLAQLQKGRRYVVLSKLEHASVLRACELAQSRNPEIVLRFLQVLENGEVDCDDLAAAFREGELHGGVALACLQAVNQESGVLQPVSKLLQLARESGALTLVDTVQAVGRLPDLWLEADYRVLAAHKIRGPKALGALIGRPGAPLTALLGGGSQERGLRPGTVDGVACAGLAVAARRARGGAARYAALASLRDALEAGVLAAFPGARIVGADSTSVRAPHVTHIVFPGLSAAELVAALAMEGVSASAGSACSAGTVDPSPVVEAALGSAFAHSAVRFSLGEETTQALIDAALPTITQVLARFV